MGIESAARARGLLIRAARLDLWRLRVCVRMTEPFAGATRCSRFEDLERRRASAGKARPAWCL